LLFILRVIEDKEEIKLLLKLFLKEHIVMFQSNHKQEINTILFNILEELSLLDVFTLEDIGMINNIAIDKYRKLFELTKNATNKYIMENLNKNLKNYNDNDNLPNKQEEQDSGNYNYFNERNYSTKNEEEKLIFSDINECKSSILSMINTYYLHFLKNKKISIAENLFKVKKY